MHTQEKRQREPGFRNRDNSARGANLSVNCSSSHLKPLYGVHMASMPPAAHMISLFISFLSRLVSLISFGAHQKRDFKPPNASFPKTGSLDAWSHLGDCKGAWE
ncbi:hypothetical protein H0G86_000699 [Trichoderma simmonsii]|uniref:Uncharacterized protein n=1 Tax=Trichoderma simmonsii TaxID=1491479 RepID=A0A8G0L5F5_9HYPO|nr:hypothetical protein H0G86_000699 [Trichoderma simmonsii]